MSELRDRLKSILPTIDKNVDETQKAGRVHPENIENLKKIGFFRAFQPAQFGGLEMDFPEFAECIVDLAKVCASTAWASALLANHAHGISLFSSKLQQEIWADNPDSLICSSVAPRGKWQKVDGGMLLSGSFGWSSGSDYAEWAVLGYMGENEVSQPGPCFAVVPRKDYVLMNDWNSVALSGTGSQTITVENAFVPDYRTQSVFSLNYGLSKGFGVHDSPIYKLPFSPVFSLGFSAVSVGIALRFIDLFTEKTKARVRAYTAKNVAASSAIQMRLAESVNQVAAALALLRSDWREMSRISRSNDTPSMDDIMNWRCHQAYVTKLSREAVGRMFEASGGGAWLQSSAMQRLFCDVHVSGSHAQTDFDIAAQTLGRHLLGVAMSGEDY